MLHLFPKKIIWDDYSLKYYWPIALLHVHDAEENTFVTIIKHQSTTKQARRLAVVLVKVRTRMMENAYAKNKPAFSQQDVCVLIKEDVSLGGLNQDGKP